MGFVESGRGKVMRMASSFSEIKALVAVGLNGDLAVLEVSGDSENFQTAVRSLPATTVFKNVMNPSHPGLYEFKGTSMPEPSPFGSVEVIFRGQFICIAPHNT